MCVCVCVCVCVIYFNLNPTWDGKALVFCVRMNMTVMYMLFLRCSYRYFHICLCLSRHAERAWSLLGISDRWDATLCSSASIPSWAPFSSATQNAFRFKSLHDKPLSLTISVPLSFLLHIADESLRWMGRERERRRTDGCCTVSLSQIWISVVLVSVTCVFVCILYTYGIRLHTLLADVTEG